MIRVTFLSLPLVEQYQQFSLETEGLSYSASRGVVVISSQTYLN